MCASLRQCKWNRLSKFLPPSYSVSSACASVVRRLLQVSQCTWTASADTYTACGEAYCALLSADHSSTAATSVLTRPTSGPCGSPPRTWMPVQCEPGGTGKLFSISAAGLPWVRDCLVFFLALPMHRQRCQHRCPALRQATVLAPGRGGDPRAAARGNWRRKQLIRPHTFSSPFALPSKNTGQFY